MDDWHLSNVSAFTHVDALEWWPIPERNLLSFSKKFRKLTNLKKDWGRREEPTPQERSQHNQLLSLLECVPTTLHINFFLLDKCANIFFTQMNKWGKFEFYSFVATKWGNISCVLCCCQTNQQKFIILYRSANLVWILLQNNERKLNRGMGMCSQIRKVWLIVMSQRNRGGGDKFVLWKFFVVCCLVATRKVVVSCHKEWEFLNHCSVTKTRGGDKFNFFVVLKMLLLCTVASKWGQMESVANEKMLPLLHFKSRDELPKPSKKKTSLQLNFQKKKKNCEQTEYIN